MRRLSLLVAVVLAALVLRPAQAQQDNQKTYEDALKSIKSTDPMERAFGLVGLALVGTDAKGASREIIGLLNDPSEEVRTRAGEALTKANPAIAEPVIALVQGTEYDKRIQAAEAIAKLGKDAGPALDAVTGFLDKAKGADRGKVVKALAAIAPDDKKTAALIANLALKDGDPAVRDAALAALSKVGDKKEQTALFLGAIKNEKDVQKRINAINALAAVGQGNQDAMKALEDLAKDPSAQVRDAAKSAVSKLKGKK
jgi:HEAT repeat protein